MNFLVVASQISTWPVVMVAKLTSENRLMKALIWLQFLVPDRIDAGVLVHFYGLRRQHDPGHCSLSTCMSIPMKANDSGATLAQSPAHTLVLGLAPDRRTHPLIGQRLPADLDHPRIAPGLAAVARDRDRDIRIGLQRIGAGSDADALGQIQLDAVDPDLVGERADRPGLERDQQRIAELGLGQAVDHGEIAALLVAADPRSRRPATGNLPRQ